MHHLVHPSSIPCTFVSWNDSVPGCFQTGYSCLHGHARRCQDQDNPGPTIVPARTWTMGEQSASWKRKCKMRFGCHTGCRCPGEDWCGSNRHQRWDLYHCVPSRGAFEILASWSDSVLFFAATSNQAVEMAHMAIKDTNALLDAAIWAIGACSRTFPCCNLHFNSLDWCPTLFAYYLFLPSIVEHPNPKVFVWVEK